MRNLFIGGLFAMAIIATPALASDIPKFGRTCVGDFKQSSSICLSSNGKAISSTYVFRGKYRTRGSHNGCALNGSSITCTGGAYSTSEGSGRMNPVVVKLAKGKPVSMRWQ